MKGGSPTDYFQSTQFNECLIISFELSNKRSEVELVTDTVEQNLPKGVRGFRKVVFNKVAYFERIAGETNGFDATTYNTRTSSGAFVIQHLACKLVSSGLYRLDMYVDSSWGGLNFAFESIDVFYKRGRGEENLQEGWDYFDADTGEPFDFYHPFPSP